MLVGTISRFVHYLATKVILYCGLAKGKYTVLCNKQQMFYDMHGVDAAMATL